MHKECQEYAFFRGFTILTYNLMMSSGHGCIY